MRLGHKSLMTAIPTAGGTNLSDLLDDALVLFRPWCANGCTMAQRQVIIYCTAC